MLKEPLISIIIPSLNQLNNLKKTILSIRDQNFKDYEVIIMDGGSTDGTVEFLKDLKGPFYRESKPDRGIYDSMNKGILKAKGKWILFLGSDDSLYDKNVLKDVFQDDFPDKIMLILGSIQYNLDEKDPVWIQKDKGLVKPEWSKKLWIRNTLHHQGIIYRRELLIKNMFPLRYKRLSDYALNLKLYKQGIDVKILDRIITLCGTKGVSKIYDKNLYREEVDLKVTESNTFLKPVFKMMCSLKYTFKNT